VITNQTQCKRAEVVEFTNKFRTVCNCLVGPQREMAWFVQTSVELKDLKQLSPEKIVCA